MNKKMKFALVFDGVSVAVLVAVLLMSFSRLSVIDSVMVGIAIGMLYSAIEFMIYKVIIFYRN
jgi:hypothetical protein